jgi:ribonuclease HI
MAKQSFLYVVWVGRMPGIYITWAEAEMQVKGYPGSKFEKFTDYISARQAYVLTYQEYLAKKKRTYKSKPIF